MKTVFLIVMLLSASAFAKEKFYMGDRVTIVEYKFYDHCTGVVSGRFETWEYTGGGLFGREPGSAEKVRMYNIVVTCKDRNGKVSLKEQDLKFYEKDIELAK